MTSRIFRSAVVIAVIVLLCSLGLVMGILYGHFSEVQTAQLKDELSLAATGTEHFGVSYLENVASRNFRLTWIAPNGTVLYDSQVDAAALDSHADREEIREALDSGTGSSIRYSDTVTEKTLYEALLLSDGSVLRISASQASAAALLLDLLPTVLLIAAAAVCFSAILARKIANRIVEPLNRLDLEHPLQNTVYSELSPLLRRINQQHLQISAQMEILHRKTDEFTQITENMREGLILLNSDGDILSINPTAAALFDIGKDCIGTSLFSVAPIREIRDAVNAALDKGSGTARIQKAERCYQLDLSRIQSNGATVGAAVLAFDITETESTEQMRREFSANVSHELKTPLQSIIGSAELLENGLVKEADIPRFVGHIRNEATRLVALIEDIIRLSQLDEGTALPTETVDLLALSKEAAASLQAAAAQQQITICVHGDPCQICGVRRLLHAIVYNLCENAVKYNVPGGRVDILVGDKVLTVSDTGIGIPNEHLSRVFERFYRVDKSHSRQSGGTGLGLSIVKHAAACHNAKLEISSTPGKGTSVTVRF